jgi:hypothetical protein
MSTNAHTVTNLRGEKITGTVRVRLKPGVGIQGVNGEHVEGGPHDLPVAIAQQLLDSNRADVVLPDDETEDVTEVEERDPVVESRDPRANRRR